MADKFRTYMAEFEFIQKHLNYKIIFHLSVVNLEDFELVL